MTGVERRHERLRVAKAARHLERLPADLDAPFDRLVRAEYSSIARRARSWARSGLSSSGSAASASSSSPARGRTDLEAGEEEKPAERD